MMEYPPFWLITIGTLLVTLLIVNYVIFGIKIAQNEFDSKLDFLVWAIPFGGIIKHIIIIWKKNEWK